MSDLLTNHSVSSGHRSGGVSELPSKSRERPYLSEEAPSDRSTGLPDEVRLLLSRNGQPDSPPWAAFLERYNRLILRIVNDRSNDYDGAMDRYAWVLEKLQEAEFDRLRRYTADGRSKFSTWLVVVVQRLCEDFRRRKYGRVQAGTSDPTQVEVRRKLADMLVEELDPNMASDQPSPSPEMALRRQELREALQKALDELDPTDRLLFKLRFEDGLQAKEIANVLLFPTPFHVYRRLSARLSTLRRVLRDHGVEESAP